ncbi:MAG: OmpA family protein, partial [Acidobacteria bacterium]|nr:OmpA family protein [Acidobacteriota bacterium]
VISIWTFLSWREQRRWNNYIDELKSTSGIVVIETGRRDGKHYVAGLRDPLSVSPHDILLQRTQLDPNSVRSRWDLYQTLDPQFVLERAKNLLKPPQGVELKIDNGMLVAGGRAPHQWIVDSRKLAPAIPGVGGYLNQELIDEEMNEIETVGRQIEQHVIRFVMGTTQLVPGQNQELSNLISETQKFIFLAPTVSRRARIQIVGHTDSEGGEDINMRLSQERASRMLSLMASRAIQRDLMTAIGVGTREPLRAESSEPERQFNRSASFKVSLIDQPQEGDRR